MRSSSRNGYGVSAWGASTTRGIVQASGERAELAVPGSRERQARTIYRPPLNTNLAQSTLRQKKLRTENQARFLMNGVCHNQVTVKWSKEVWATPTTEEGTTSLHRASVQDPSIPPSRPQGVGELLGTWHAKRGCARASGAPDSLAPLAYNLHRETYRIGNGGTRKGLRHPSMPD